MPKFFKQHLLTPPHLLENPHLLDGPEEDHFEHEEIDEDFILGQSQIKTLFSWTAPSRPHRKRSRSYYTTIFILITLTCLIAFLFGEKLFIGALLAFTFVVYVLAFIPPNEIEYKISTQGITIGDHFYHWQELDSFWITEKDGFKILYIPTYMYFPSVLMLVLANVNEEEVKKTVVRFLPFQEIAPKSTFEKWADNLQKHFPLEAPQH